MCPCAPAYKPSQLVGYACTFLFWSFVARKGRKFCRRRPYFRQRNEINQDGPPPPRSRRDPQHTSMPPRSTVVRYATLTQSRGIGSETGSKIEIRQRLVDTIVQNIAARIQPARIKLLDVAVAQCANAFSDGCSALEKGLHVCHATPAVDLPGGLLPMTYSMKDGERPEIAVPELWLTSSIRRSVEHVLDSHYSAVHMHGIRIIIIGPGAPDLFHVKIVNSFGINNGSSVGCDFLTSARLPSLPQQPWNFGTDTFVINIASPMSDSPWSATILHDSLLSGASASRALTATNNAYFNLERGCSKCHWDLAGCTLCNRRGCPARVEGIAPPIRRYDPVSRSLLGQRITKQFPDGEWYEGTIKSLCRGLYKVEYDDGDTEEYSEYLTKQLEHANS